MNPLGYPSLAEATLPDDRIAIALGPQVPQPGEVVAGILETLLPSGSSSRHVTVLTADDKRLAAEVAQSVASFASAATWTHHDPADRSQLSYLAADQAARPIYVHRAICDADLVLSVECESGTPVAGFGLLPTGVFPTFSDTETRQRFAHCKAPFRRSAVEQQQAESRQAEWLLGLQFVMRVVPAVGDAVHSIVAGDRLQVLPEARRRYRDVWKYGIRQGYSLAIASICGGPRRQTWSHLVRALVVARRLTRDDAAIALCTEIPSLASLPRWERNGHSRRAHMSGGNDFSSPLHDLLRERHVYLLSHLDADAVEELGMTPVDELKDLSVLCRRADDCLLIPDAPHCLPLRRRQSAS